MFFFSVQLYNSFGQLYNNDISLCHPVVPLLDLCEHSDKNDKVRCFHMCLNTSKIGQQISHLELFNICRTQVMDPHHCGETEAPEVCLGLWRDPFILAEPVAHLTHFLLCESQNFRLQDGSARKRRDHY